MNEHLMLAGLGLVVWGLGAMWIAPRLQSSRLLAVGGLLAGGLAGLVGLGVMVAGLLA